MFGLYVLLQETIIIKCDMAVWTRNVCQAGWLAIVLVDLSYFLPSDEVHFYFAARRNMLSFTDYSVFRGGTEHGIEGGRGQLCWSGGRVWWL